MKNCIAIASDGTWFNTQENLAQFKGANPSVFTVSVGSAVTILKQTLLSFGTKGVVKGFDRSSTGKPLLLIKWDENAAPLRVGIEAVMPCAPKKFWMVIPFKTSYAAQYDNQSSSYTGEARRGGTAPAVKRFNSRERAERYIENESMATGFHDYVILESVEFQTRGIVVPIV